MLVAFPIALLGMTPVLDGLAWAGVLADAAGAAYLCELAGLIGGGLAVVTGFVDFMKIGQSEHATAKTAIIHASFAVTMLSLFAIAFALRGPRTAAVSLAPLALEAAGVVVLAATGWYGGHLVFRHGVGVEAPRRP
jgi:uncharacterized membrane protein